MFNQIIRQQSVNNPQMYGNVNFDEIPERFDFSSETLKPSFETLGVRNYDDSSDAEYLRQFRQYAMLGDPVADAYIALLPKLGFQNQIAMLKQAFGSGIGSVPDTPPELVTLYHSMHEIPEWIDMDLVREGIEASRPQEVFFVPYIIRGAFFGTFMNRYSALPMALTGALTSKGAAKRIRETANFFATTTLPGAFEKGGPGLKAAAMVRLMHSMVRFSLINNDKVWDRKVYGIPIPQIDQMPAGIILSFLLAFKMVRSGRADFTKEERAKVELARYRCYLLGLPEFLLETTPIEIMKSILALDITLRKDYDEEICGTLMRTTIDAYIPMNRLIGSRLFNFLERRTSRLYFTKEFLNNDAEKAAQFGIRMSFFDKLIAVATLIIAIFNAKAFTLLAKVPGISELVHKFVVRRLHRVLASYGHADFVTEGSKPSAPH